MRSFPSYIIILLASLLIATGTNFFLVPYKILDGGIIGIALIINYISGTKIGLCIMLCSLPIFLLAWFRQREIFYNSILGLLASSLLIELLFPLQYYFLYYIEPGLHLKRHYRRLPDGYRTRADAALQSQHRRNRPPRQIHPTLPAAECRPDYLPDGLPDHRRWRNSDLQGDLFPFDSDDCFRRGRYGIMHAGRVKTRNLPDAMNKG